MSVVSLLGIVHKVLQYKGQHLGVGIAQVFLTDGSKGALLVEEGHQTLVVAHLGKHLSCLVGLARLVKGTSIDVLHHILIDRLDELVFILLPEGDILRMFAQQHVTTHIEQRVLRAQTTSGLAESIGADGSKCLVALGKLFFGGVVPLLPSYLLGALKVLAEVLHIAYHQRVTFLLGRLDDLVFSGGKIEPGVIVEAEVGFPVVRTDGLHTIAELGSVVDTEQIIVVGFFPCTGEYWQYQHRHQISDDKSLHRFLVCIY